MKENIFHLPHYTMVYKDETVIDGIDTVYCALWKVPEIHAYHPDSGERISMKERVSVGMIYDHAVADSRGVSKTLITVKIGTQDRSLLRHQTLPPDERKN